MDRYCMTGCLETWRQVPQCFVSATVGQVCRGTAGVGKKKCIYVGVYVCVFSRFNFYAFMLILRHLPVDTNVCVYPIPAMY